METVHGATCTDTGYTDMWGPHNNMYGVWC